ncbi:MAG: hypothetical protein HY851_06390, partial [candidate division Zixibacteria bacterium]|nr:hypothetical protein [candidate division Zixibacteria bacterium]MBI5266845.1 hypothetical protein [candidate division Zixibacteria bacterium]
TDAQTKLHALATKGKEQKSTKPTLAHKTAGKPAEEIIPLEKEEMATF